MQVKGVLPASGVAITTGKALGLGTSIPATANLTSTSANRKIELSTDNGVSYFAAELNSETISSIAIGLLAPVTHIKFTGNSGDKWSVL